MEIRILVQRINVGLVSLIILLSSNAFFVQQSESASLEWKDLQRGVGLPSSSPEPRVALVIGNSNYHVGPLSNPVNDARAMGTALQELGFDVAKRENLTGSEMKKEIREFGLRLRKGGVGLFYFAGHGIQMQGQNYLLPIDAEIERQQDVQYEGVNVELVLNEMNGAENRVNIIILDACRNNLFARSYRSVERGLALVNAPSGTIIAYATAPGSVASDGKEQNGVYTQELLKSMRITGLKVEDLFKQVRVAVREKTKGKQIPWESSSLEGDFYFRKPDTTATGANPHNTQQNALPPSSLVQSLKGTMWLEHGTTIDGNPAFIEFLEGGALRRHLGIKGKTYIIANMVWYQTENVVHIIVYRPGTKRKEINYEVEGVIKGDRIEGTLYWKDKSQTSQPRVYTKVIR